jgi:hypothetical protein
MSKRKRLKRKERITEIRVAFDRDVTIGGISAPGIDPMQFFGVDGKPIVPTRIELGVGYSRNKPALKMIQRATADPLGMHPEPTRALMRFPTILAADTNTRVIGGTRISVTAFLVVRDLRFDELEPRRWHATIVDQDSYEFHDATVAAELLGWKNVLERAVASAVPTPAVLIVDSELARLERYNRREESIVDGFVLPNGFELMYASAERGATEFVGNAALAECDRTSTSILDRIERDPIVRAWPTNDPPSRWVKCHRILEKELR